MRILVISQYFWPENFRVNDLVRELVLRGHNVSVLTGLPNYPDGKIFPEYLTSSNSFSEYSGARIHRVPMITRGNGGFRLILNFLTFALSASFFGTWKLRGLSYDIIFTYEPSPVTVGLPAIFLRYIKHAPLVFWVQDLWPETLQAVGAVRSSALLSMVGRFVAFIYKRCDLILAQSKSFVPQIRKYAPPDSLVHYFPNWSDDVAVTNDMKLANEVPIKSGSFNVMFAGNIGVAQDFPAILSAAERLKQYSDIRWLIVGDGRMASWVRNEVERRHLQNNVLMLGRFPPERMDSFFQHADALLVSLKDEPIYSMTIPSKLQTYLAAGLPVLSMMNGEGSDVVRESGSGLTCKAGDDELLAASVLKLSKMSQVDRKKMGRNGIIFSQREFDRDTLISRLEGWFVQISLSS